MKVTILGCGTSSGVPMVGNLWGACDPAEPKNRRLRPSVLVEQGNTALLIDTSPDLREQLLACNLQHLTAVLYTHAHADHSHGIDDLRSVNWLMEKPIPVYADGKTLEDLTRRFDYIFVNRAEHNYYKPGITPHELSAKEHFGEITVTPFKQDHGYSESMGFRCNDFAYTTDAKRLDDYAFSVLAGIKVWVVDCVREREHQTHSHLEQTLAWIERIKPDRAYLTHMDNSMDFQTLLGKLPANVWPAYDGLVIQL